MSSEISLHHRRRAPTPQELAAIPWLRVLDPEHRPLAEREIQVGDARSGDFVCRTGRAVTYWFGVVDGLLKMSGDNADGRSMTFTGVPPGGWFGEGTALKREPYRYNIQALRKSVVAGLPVDSFHWLLDHSLGFNRFVMNQINERLGQFIGALETDWLNNPDARVARSLAALFNPVLYSLSILQAQGVIRVEYGGVRVLDLDALRRDPKARLVPPPSPSALSSPSPSPSSPPQPQVPLPTASTVSFSSHSD